MSWVVVGILTIFLIIWMALTFTNQLCVGPVGFGLCYKSADDPACPACPVCPKAPAPSPAPAPTPRTVSTYEPEAYLKE